MIECAGVVVVVLGVSVRFPDCHASMLWPSRLVVCSPHRSAVRSCPPRSLTPVRRLRVHSSTYRKSGTSRRLDRLTINVNDQISQLEAWISRLCVNSSLIVAQAQFP